MNDFAKRLKLLRREAGVSQAFIAEHIGISVQSVSNWECSNTMPDISQIVPLASILSVSTDYLLGVGTDEMRDKAELDAEIGRIWATYSVNTPEDNADMLAAGAYRRYLTRYPLDYGVKYKCALAICDYLAVVSERGAFDIPSGEWDALYSECGRMLGTVCDNCTDAQLLIDAQKAVVSLLMLGQKWDDAVNTAWKLPEVCGIRAQMMTEIARKMGDFGKAAEYAESACGMKLTEYVNALFYRAKSLSDDPAALKEDAVAAWEDMQSAARLLTDRYCNDADLSVNAFEKNPYCYLITSYTACSNYLLECGDIAGAIRCAEMAADHAIEMIGWAEKRTSDPLVMSDILFFASHTPGWCCRWVSDAKRDAFCGTEEYRDISERIRALVGDE